MEGQKMAGQYGVDTITTQNLKVVAVYPEDGLVLVTRQHSEMQKSGLSSLTQ